MTVLFDSSSGFARCSAAESTLLALRRALSIVARDFDIPHDYPLRGDNCRDLANSWKECVASILSGIRRERTRWTVASALKSCLRLFDRRCERCDTLSARDAINAWSRGVADRTALPSVPWSEDLIGDLKKRLRPLIDGWGSRLEIVRKESGVGGCSDVYFPDQQGCLEASRRRGGTLSVPTDVAMRSDPSRLRVGVAKTKGKLRVVTMQSARVKRVLRPVHTALYDHISSFGWCVRGEVRKEDFLAVSADRRGGESIISGDYSSATDKIRLEAVEAMVQVLQESPDLTVEEREVLGQSFAGLQYQIGVCGSSPLEGIHRGQMMGSLVSFPLLCLLNKVCFDLTTDLVSGTPGTSRVGRFNGDDCLFAGDRRVYEVWQQVTAAYGFVVNVTKTGFSRRFGELNSRCFDYARGVFLRKIVLSFLRPVERDQCGDILCDIVEGIKHLQVSTQQWVVNCLMRHEISLRTISVGSLPKHWFRSLLKRRWFRDALRRDPTPTIEYGDDRSLPVKLGPLPIPRLHPTITALAGRLASEHTERWTGVRAEPFVRRLVRGKRQPVLPRSPYLSVLRKSWAFLWPTELLSFFERNFAHWAFLPPAYSRSKWADDHQFLTVVCEAVSGGLRGGQKDFRAIPDTQMTGIPSGGIVYCVR
nr:MAG: putative RNA-dependent RNA polymerase [Botoulivirus sp.]